jgi:protocatechuate 3,4-dioxygenase beta subunit
MGHEVHDHDGGLAVDLSTLVNRRLVLGLMAGAGLTALVGCDNDPGSSTAAGSPSAADAGSPSAARSPSAAASSGSGSAAESVSCAEIPEETAGPYPGDGSNGPSVLTQSGIVRSDIRSSFGSASAVAEGVPLTVKLTVLDTAKGCAPPPSAAVYIWHCDRDGNYSMYAQGLTKENYLRGVQETDAQGVVTFQSVFPGRYAGRWPHIHFEVYPSLGKATTPQNKVATSQLAFPKAACDSAYAADGYRESLRNLAQVSLDSDNVFGDGYTTQLATVTGSASAGFVASLAVPV